MEITEGSLGCNVPTISGLGSAHRGALVKIENDGTELEHAFEARHPLALSVGQGATTTGGGHFSGELEKDFLCPICMQTIRDAFLTACGHSFCYSCINTHLQNRQNCPCCSQYLTVEQLFPNFLLNKLLQKASTQHFVTKSSPTEHLRLALQQGTEVSLKELDSLIKMLAEKKQHVQQEEAEVNMEILMDFLEKSRRQKQEQLDELQADLDLLQEDLSVIELRKESLAGTRERIGLRKDASTWDGQSKGGEVGLPVTGMIAATAAKKRRVFMQFDDLQAVYLNQRRKSARVQEAEKEAVPGPGEPAAAPAGRARDKHGRATGLDQFSHILSAYTKYSQLRVVAELRHGDLFHSSNIVSSIEFDRDNELFATAGVSRRIKVFEFTTVVNEMADVHCPVVEMSTRSKLSCLSWNKYIKAHIASSDYEGIVTVWDINTCQSVMEYEEHEKRAWSVDFSRTEPTQLVSGSDDGKVKVWSTREENSVLNIDMKANICCVKYNPGSSNFVAVGSADHHIHYFDLRKPQEPLFVFMGHKKAVSYVKFINETELASASTDSTLRLWDVKENCLMRTLRGHTNEKNFVGLSVNKDYVTCGSETNEIYVYYKAMSKAAAVHKFGCTDPVTGEESEDDAGHFISAVCWKEDSSTMLAANSQGTIKALVLSP
ncbi:Hypothetical protein KFL_000020060 [Klebsormidium nitens]|uniref:RING-type domain-containing protein n=1 Tax=Klebsormidium nitens TaxID=105231 RepID=A0A1Y1HGF7_KLENI|nr:Hypothetical protein KFL_000020060 [Klebsormidium nitens]|eukprot:GAQ77645.1 Hypothetical protein KFL_000020060 [Klebsormidium nitens]